MSRTERKPEHTESSTTTTYQKLVAERSPKAIHIEQGYHDWKKILDRFLTNPDDQLSDVEAAYAETIALLIGSRPSAVSI